MTSGRLAAEEPQGAGSRQGQLECCDSKLADAKLVSLAAGRCVWQLPDGTLLDTETASVVAWGNCPPWPVGSHLLLADGGVVAGRLESLDDRLITIRSPALGRIEIPAAAAAGYRGTAASRPPIAADGPVVDLVNGDRINARSIRVAEGIASVSWQGGSVSIPLERVHAFDLTGVPQAVPRFVADARPAVRLALVDGSRGPLALFGERLPVDRVLAIRVDGGCAIDLVGLDPIGSDAAEPVRPLDMPSQGRTLAGAPPGFRGQSGFTGLGIRTPARISYRIDPPANRFESSVAIDDSAGQGGKAIVRVVFRSVDGDLREALASTLIRAGDPPIGIRVGLDRARQIELVVEAVAGDRDPAGTFWLDPRVVAAGRGSAVP